MANTVLIARTSGWWAVGETAQQVLDNILATRKQINAQKRRELKKFLARKVKGLDLASTDDERSAVIEFDMVPNPLEIALEQIHDSMPIRDLEYGSMDDVRSGFADALAGVERKSQERYYTLGWFAFQKLTERYGRLRPLFVTSRAA